MPRARHLAQVLAQHEFQEALKNYRDLRFLARNLEDWREKLGIFEDMLATRRKAFADRLPPVRERQQQIDIEALVKRREAVAAEVAAGEAAGDGVAFADAKQLDLLAAHEGDASHRRRARTPTRRRSSSATGCASSAACSPGSSSQDSVGRLWDAKVELERIDAELAEAQAARRRAVGGADARSRLRFDRFAAASPRINPQLQVMIPRVAALSREQRRRRRTSPSPS